MSPGHMAAGHAPWSTRRRDARPPCSSRSSPAPRAAARTATSCCIARPTRARLVRTGGRQRRPRCRPRRSARHGRDARRARHAHLARPARQRARGSMAPCRAITARRGAQTRSSTRHPTRPSASAAIRRWRPIAEAGLAVMFRNHIAGSRDLYVTRSDRWPRASRRPRSRGRAPGSWTPARWTAADWSSAPAASPACGGGRATSSWRRPARRNARSASVATRSSSASPAAVDVAWTTPDGILLQRGTDEPSGWGRASSRPSSPFPAHSLLAWEQQGQVVTQVVPR